MALAALQLGLVSTWQLATLDVTPAAVKNWVRRGRLFVWHRGVSSVGHPGRTPEAVRLAAVLAGGPAAALSHRSAAEHRGTLRPREGSTHITVPTRRRARAGLVVHERPLAGDVEIHRGIPITTVRRTLIDLAGTGDERAAREAAQEAETTGLLGAADVGELGALTGVDGAPLLRSIFDGMDGERIRSRAERALAQALRRRRILERVNAAIEIGGRVIEPDFAWPAIRLAVEIDGRGPHDTAQRFESDRERVTHYGASGWTVLTFTAKAVLTDPVAIASRIEQVQRARVAARSGAM